MKRIIRFQMDGKAYQVLVDRVGDELTIEGEGQRHRAVLLREAVGQGSSAAATAPQTTAEPRPTPAPSAAAAPSAAPPASAGGSALLAPMTGVVKEIRVSVGHNVQKGQVVLIMEAMKMDIEVPTLATGVVAEVSVRAGENVSAKQPLMLIQ